MLSELSLTTYLETSKNDNLETIFRVMAASNISMP
jgi:hypothetical protein